MAHTALKISNALLDYTSGNKLSKRLGLVTYFCNHSVCDVRFGKYSEARSLISDWWCMYGRLHHWWGAPCHICYGYSVRGEFDISHLYHLEACGR